MCGLCVCFYIFLARRNLNVISTMYNHQPQRYIGILCNIFLCPELYARYCQFCIHGRGDIQNIQNVLVFCTIYSCIRVLLVLHTRASRWRRAAPICSNQLIEFPLCGNCGNLPNSENYSISTAPAPSATRGVCPAAPKLVSQKREIYSKTKFNPTEHTLGAVGREKQPGGQIEAKSGVCNKILSILTFFQVDVLITALT